jgi:hypothetical protein
MEGRFFAFTQGFDNSIYLRSDMIAVDSTCILASEGR